MGLLKLFDEVVLLLLMLSLEFRDLRLFLLSPSPSPSSYFPYLPFKPYDRGLSLLLLYLFWVDTK